MPLLKKRKNYLYFAPHVLLRPYIAHYTVSFAQPELAASDQLTLIPDASGCLVFTLREHRLIATAWGPTTKTVVIKNDGNLCPFRFFVEFLPGGLAAFFGCQKDFADVRLPLAAIDSVLCERVNEAFEQAFDLAGFIARMDELLLARLPLSALPALMSSSLGRIWRSKGVLPVKQLAQLEVYSERHLNRMFHSYLGMNVKTYARILRVNHAVQQMKEQKMKLGLLSQHTGFYDQSHFIRDFKSICNTTPTQYLAHMSDFYNELLKF